jgi:hypothetical protein
MKYRSEPSFNKISPPLAIFLMIVASLVFFLPAAISMNTQTSMSETQLLPSEVTNNNGDTPLRAAAIIATSVVTKSVAFTGSEKITSVP